MDLFPRYILTNTLFSINNVVYSKTNIRIYLVMNVYNGFTEEIKNAMKVQSFPSNGETLNDKVKCPSSKELGYLINQSPEEGTIYPIFGSSYTNRNGSSSLSLAYYFPNGSHCLYYLLRTIYNSRYILNIYNGLQYNASEADDRIMYGIIGCIRF